MCIQWTPCCPIMPQDKQLFSLKLSTDWNVGMNILWQFFSPPWIATRGPQLLRLPSFPNLHEHFIPENYSPIH